MSTQAFGGWLRRAREARGLSVEAIASQTKIPPRHLEALERGDALPLPRFYQRAEVRAVARAMGVDERFAIARLEAELAPVELALPVSSEPARVRPEYAFAMVAMLVIAVGLAGWGSFERAAATAGTVETPKPVAAPPVAPPAAPPAAPPSIEAPKAVVPTAPTVETVTAVAPDPEPVAPAGPAELVISTQPDGARVTVNGIGWGESPITLQHLEPGEQRIRVTMDGYTATERSVVIDGHQRQSVRIGLEPSRP
jgi:cytoskeletal protein RodZ